MPGISRRASKNPLPARAQIEAIVSEILSPGHFFASEPDKLLFERILHEEISWEVFRGRLLDPTQTRAQRSFSAWNVLFKGDADNLVTTVVSVKYDEANTKLFVLRALPCHAWEGYHAGDNVYLSRETIKQVRELVGSVDLTREFSRDELRDELAGLVFRAVVGTSRLPLTSVEAPLPAFALGQVGYFFKPGREMAPTDVMHGWEQLIERGLHAEQSWFEKARLLELLLRAAPGTRIEDGAVRFAGRWQVLGHAADEILSLLRTVFNEVSLSPYTQFVDNALAFVQVLVDQGLLPVGRQVDFLSFLLRQLGRHLTAYDLVTFHHAGANYPDALLLDAILKRYLGLIDGQPELFTTHPADSKADETKKRLRRRALRQGWLLRRHYEGHAVPDAPTSPGENARVMPAPYLRVPEEQLTQPARRTRRLYADDLLPEHLGRDARAVLRQSVRDLHHIAELQELGMAVFIERPLGVFKAVGEPDQTLLLASEAFSKKVAARRLAFLEGDAEIGLEKEEAAGLRQSLEQISITGLAVDAIAEPHRPVVSLADARRVAADFVFLRTLRRGVSEFGGHFDLTPLKTYDADLLDPREPWLLARVAGSRDGMAPITVFDGMGRKRLELEMNADQGYVSWAGKEYPAAGLRVLRLWSPSGQEYDLGGTGIVLLPRADTR